MEDVKLPKTQQKLLVRKLTTNFRQAVKVETVELQKPGENEVLIKNKYVGIGADEINVVRGRQYFAGDNIPFGVGYEGAGSVVAIGAAVTGLKVGDSVCYIDLNHTAFAEYTCAQQEYIFPVPAVVPEYLVLLISGLTAFIGLDKYGEVKKDDKVLITAASGGIGHIAVQLAKNSGCFVIGICSTKEKEIFLKGLGCDDVINYREENLSEVLSKKYPEGVNVIWESVGGEMFDIALNHIAEKGRLLIIGGTSEYKTDEKDCISKSNISSSKFTVLYRGLSIIGCNMDLYREFFDQYYKLLLSNFESGKIKPVYVMRAEKSEFVGIRGIVDAVEHLYKGKHIGKILAKIY